MTSEFSPLEGGCQCGQVRFRIAAPPVITMACHCSGCQRMSASAFSLSAVIPSVAFFVNQVNQWEPVIGGLHGPTHHFFCPNCMSWMFTRPDGFDAIVNIRVPVLDDPRPFPPFMLGFSDCLILETARKAGHLPLGTFERNLAKLDGAEGL